MNKAIQMIFTVFLACGSASAVTTYNFDFASLVSSSGASLSAYSGGLGVTVSGWYTSNTTTPLAAATVGNYNGYGLGICNSATESGNNCGVPEHQIDNNGRYEFMLFKFSVPVNLSSVLLVNYGGASNSIDRDMTYYKSTSTASSITLGSLSSLGNGFASGTNVLCAGNCSGSSSLDALSGTSVSYLLIGAAAPGTGDGTADYFKIESLSVTTDASPVTAAPEPSTIQMGVLIVAGLFVGIRRRKRKASREY